MTKAARLTDIACRLEPLYESKVVPTFEAVTIDKPLYMALPATDSKHLEAFPSSSKAPEKQRASAARGERREAAPLAAAFPGQP